MNELASRLIVLRIPAEDENYVFRIAELSERRAREVENDILTGNMVASEIDQTFGRPMDLAHAVKRPHEFYTVIQPPPSVPEPLLITAD